MSLANYYRYREIDSTKTVDYLLKSVEVSKEANYTYCCLQPPQYKGESVKAIPSIQKPDRKRIKV